MSSVAPYGSGLRTMVHVVSSQSPHATRLWAQHRSVLRFDLSYSRGLAQAPARRGFDAQRSRAKPTISTYQTMGLSIATCQRDGIISTTVFIV